MNTHDVNKFITQVRNWAVQCPDILAVGYVGSWARGTAKPGSDLDLMIVTSDPKHYSLESSWVSFFGEVQKITQEDWGIVKTWRVFFDHAMEVEFNITTEEWSNTNPIDPGTRRVVSEGMEIVYDPQAILSQLKVAVQS